MKIPKVVWNPVPRSEVADSKQVGVRLPNAQWNQLPGVQDPIPLRVFSGYSSIDPYSLKDSYATSTKNMSSIDFPAMSVRVGNSLVGTAFGAAIQGMGSWKDTELHVVAGGVWYKWNGSSWTTLLSGLNATAKVSFVNFKGNLTGMNLMMANGIDAPRRYDGSTVQTLGGAPAGGNFIDQHDNRMYMAVGNMVHASALRKPEDWTTAKDAQQIAVENQNGENIVGLKAGAGHIIAFLPNSVHELWGTGPKDWRMQIISEDIGLINNQCTVNISGVLYFMDTRGVYRYTGGTTPSKDFSFPIQEYIEKMNLAASDQCSLGTDGKNLYVSFPSTGSSVADTILEYSPQFDTWYIWKDYAAVSFARVKKDCYIGEQNGRVLKLGGTTNNGTAITWEWISKPFNSTSLAQKLQWHRLWYAADIPPGSTMNVYLSRDAEGDSDWMLVKTATSDDTITGKIMLPVNAVSNANWLRVKFTGSGPVTIREIDRQQRMIPLG